MVTRQINWHITNGKAVHGLIADNQRKLSLYAPRLSSVIYDR